MRVDIDSSIPREVEVKVSENIFESAGGALGARRRLDAPFPGTDSPNPRILCQSLSVQLAWPTCVRP